VTTPLLSIVPSDRSHLVTFFPNYAASTKTEERLTLEELAQRVRTITAAEKDRLPWLKLARFGDKESGSLRTNENVVRVTGAVVDYDGEKMSPEDAAKQLYEAAIEGLIYTSPSHTDEKPRWRAVCPFSQELPPEEHYKMVARLNGLFGGILAAESFTLSQSYYYGSVNGKPAARTILVDGTRRLDESDDLDEFATGKPNGDGRQHAGGKPDASIDDIRAALEVIPNPMPSWGPKRDTWKEWNDLGMAVWRSSGGSEDGFKEFDGYSKKWKEKYDKDETEFRWNHYFKSPPTSIGFGKLVYWARETKPDWRPPSRREPGNSNVVFKRFEKHAITDIPKRRWAYGNFLLEGDAAVVGAIDGTGKGFWAVATALAIITDQPLLGEEVHRKGSIALLTYEDDEDEWRRRIGAACTLHNISYEDVIDKFYFIGKPEETLYLAQAAKGGQVIYPDHEAIVTGLREHGCVGLIIDPFNQAVALEDGNNNFMIAKVANEARRIAQQADVFVLVLHHLRKGSTGSTDDLMGATALRATFRACRILARMTADEADDLKLKDHWRHFRISSSKENYAPPPDRVAWYRINSIAIGNGDNVGAVDTWRQPSPFENIDLDQIKTVFDRIRHPPEPDEFWCSSAKAAHWFGNVIKEVGGTDEAVAGRIIKEWVENGVLIEDKYQSRKARKMVNRVTLNEIKAAEILAAERPRFDDF
jgi:AAA domain/Primase C terminal 2 (PriCT-2)